MSLTIANIDAVLKKIITPTIQNQVNDESIFLSKIKPNVGISVMNNNFYVASRTGRHSGVYSVAEGTEPRAGKAAYAQPYAPVKYMFGTLEITEQAMAATLGGDKKAIASALAFETMSLKDSLKKDFNRIAHGDGVGKLC